MTSDLNAPVLTRKKKDNSEETLDFLKSIDSRLSDIPEAFLANKKSKANDRSTIVNRKTQISDSFSDVKFEKYLDKQTKSFSLLSNKLNTLVNVLNKGTINKERKINEPKKEDALSPIRDSFKEFQKYISTEIDATKIPEKFLDKYVEKQNDIAEKQYSRIDRSLDRLTDSILAKPKLEDKDRDMLMRVDDVQTQLHKLKPAKQDDTFVELQKSIDEMNESILSMQDTEGMTRKDAKEYRKRQQQELGKKQEELQENLKDERNKILSKSKLTDEDKIKLKDLKKFQKENESYGLKEKGWLGKKLDNFKDGLGSNIKDGSQELADATAKGLLGPLNLILEPISDLFGIKFSTILDSITGKDKDEYTKKGKKIKPKRSDILKSNPEIVYLADEQKKSSKSGTSDKKESDNGFASAIEGALGAGLLSKLAIPALLETLLPVLIPALITAAMAAPIIAVLVGALNNAKERTAEENKFASEHDIDLNKTQADVGNTQIETLKVLDYGKGGTTTAQEANKANQAAQEGGFAGGGDLAVAGKKAETATVAETPWTTQTQFGIDKSGSDYFVHGSKKPLSASDKKAIMDMNRAVSVTGNTNEIDNADGSFDSYYNLVTKKFGNGAKRFHSGGIVTGATNTEVPAILKTKERVLTEKQDGDLVSALNSVKKSNEKSFDYDNMSIDLSSISDSIEKNSKGNEIVANLKILIDVMKSKNFNNLVNTNVVQSQDYNRLRSALC